MFTDSVHAAAFLFQKFVFNMACPVNKISSSLRDLGISLNSSFQNSCQIRISPFFKGNTALQINLAVNMEQFSSFVPTSDTILHQLDCVF